MSVLALCIQTGVLASWKREVFASQNEFGEQVVTHDVIHSDIPIRKQTMRQEELIEFGIPTDMASINWLCFLPLNDPATGLKLDIRSGDIMTVQDSRMQNPESYFNVIIPENATEEDNHWEVILQEFTQQEA
jgi:hypothetical protein